MLSRERARRARPTVITLAVAAAAQTSPHVQGDAVDVGPWAATAWLTEHGAGYGLCQVYANEPWHDELRPDAVDEGCPEPYADPTHDPRMQP